MGKFNEIQDEKTQSWGSNSFTTTVKEDTVEFDSAKDKFTFKDAVEVPSLKVNGSQVSAQVQADWNQNNSAAADYIKNKPTIPSAQVQADWNQTDNTANDYIKNKPFGEELLFDISSHSGSSSFTFKFSSVPELGKSYVIQFNTNYESVGTYDASSSYGAGAIGFTGFSNGSIYYIPSDSGDDGSYSGNPNFTTCKSVTSKKIELEYLSNAPYEAKFVGNSTDTIDPSTFTETYNLSSLKFNTDLIDKGVCLNYKFTFSIAYGSEITIPVSATKGSFTAVKKQADGILSYSNNSIVIDATALTQNYTILFDVYAYVTYTGYASDITLVINYTLTR